MEISDRLRCLYSAQVEERDGRYVVDVPAQEIQLGDIEAGETYRIALLPVPSVSETGTEESPAPPTRDRSPPEPPVDEGEQRDVEIEDIGEQGDGITRVERASSLSFRTRPRASASLSRLQMCERTSLSPKL